MRSGTKVFFVVCALILITAAAANAVKPQIPVTPSRYVVDLAGIVDDNIETRLNGYLQELEQKTSAQMVVLTILSLEGESIFDLSLNIAHNRWKLGQKGRDNGVLMLVAVQERKYHIQVGYGLEGVLPDSLVGSIGRQHLVPYFIKSDYSSGISAAALAIITEIATEANVEITGMPKLRTLHRNVHGYDQDRKPSLLGTIFTILFFLGLMYLFIRHPRLLLFLIMMNLLGGGRRGGWGGGGGFGGGFGSFGGGGGGGFGGAGAGGSW